MIRARPEHPVELASLPADDPLRRALANDVLTPELVRAIARADAEEPALRAALADLPIPALEDRLLAISGSEGREDTSQRPRLVSAVSALAVAAALVLAFAIGHRIGRDDVTPATIAAAPLVAPDIAPARSAPDIVAIKVWHPSCPACKALDPRYASVVDAFDDGSVLFMTFDLSTDASRRQAELLVAALGVQELFDDPLAFLGSVVLIDPDTKTRIGQVTAKQDEDEMKGSIRDAIARSRT